MTQTIPPEQFTELLGHMKKLAGLVDPLRAIIDAEKKPELTERIESFLSEMNRIGDLMAQAVTAMETDQESRTALQRLEKQMDAQSLALEEIDNQMRIVLRLFGAPLDDPEPN